MAAGFTNGTIHPDLQGWECQTSTGVGALGMDGIGSSARHVWRPISPSLNFCNFSFKRKVNETRMYDPAVGRMLSPDIVIQQEHNSQAYNRYSYCFNNPLRFTDPSGEEIVIDGKEQTKNDIISIVDPKYQNRISFENNIVMVDINNLSIDEIISDAGLSLINNLSISDNRFYYETKSVDNNLGIENNSVTSRNEAGKKGDVLPEGFQGHIAMNDKNIWYDDKDNKINRCSIVFHELQENYERTEHSLPYMYLIKEYDNKVNFKRLINDSNRKGAHDTAILKAEKLTSSARSSYPEGTIHHIKKEQEYE